MKAMAMGVMGFKAMQLYMGLWGLGLKHYMDRVKYDFMGFEVKTSFMWVRILRFDFKSWNLGFMFGLLKGWFLDWWGSF